MTRDRGRMRYRSCSRKTRFDSEHEAAKWAKRVGLRVYPCSFCDGYHVTSKALTDHGRRA